MNANLPMERDRDAWQLAIWNLPEADISRSQKLQLMLMLEAGFNAFDPFVAVGDLLRHRNLWEGVIMERAFVLPEGLMPGSCRMATDLIALRDIQGGHWNVDTLYILTTKANEPAWQEVIGNWRADEVNFLEGAQVGALLGAWGSEEQYSILRLWWD